MTPRALYLLRHAKSSWSDERLDDRERPLAARGREAVKRLRRHIADVGMAPQLVLCSSARRTVMTLEGIAPALPPDVVIEIDEGLYGASHTQLLARLRRVDDRLTRLLLIGHNPGIQALGALLAGGGDGALQRRLTAHFPTGALATLRFAGAWRELAPGGATLEAFVVPREL